MTRLTPDSTEPSQPSLTADRADAAAPGRQWVFGYGSLAHAEDLVALLARHKLPVGAHRHAELVGFARSWTVAMDNRQTLPRYKYYLDPVTGARPEVFVAFANIEPHDQARIWGLLFEVDAATLALLDTRERNYRRADVTARTSVSVDGTVWAYVGNPEANARYQHGLRDRTLVIDRGYAQSIESAFVRAGLPYAAALPDDVPLVALTWVDT